MSALKVLCPCRTLSLDISRLNVSLDEIAFRVEWWRVKVEDEVIISNDSNPLSNSNQSLNQVGKISHDDLLTPEWVHPRVPQPPCALARWFAGNSQVEPFLNMLKDDDDGDAFAYVCEL